MGIGFRPSVNGRNLSKSVNNIRSLSRSRVRSRSRNRSSARDNRYGNISSEDVLKTVIEFVQANDFLAGKAHARHE